MSSIQAAVTPIIATVTPDGLKEVLVRSFEYASPTLAKIEDTFNAFSSRRPSVEAACGFIKSWHSTHLKMLPIYGLSCRLQQLAMAEASPKRDLYFVAAALNAETSYEDLSVGTPHLRTHAQLFDDLAEAICGNDAWRLDSHCIPEAAEFKSWIYHNMVHAPIETGLLTNMFSEIYNHGEYSFAMLPFETLLRRIEYDDREVKRLSVYIRCHVDSSVEEAHFNCVLNALNTYNRATGSSIDLCNAESLFTEYLERSGAIMEALRHRIDALQ
jgi:hypothetical protein